MPGFVACNVRYSVTVKLSGKINLSRFSKKTKKSIDYYNPVWESI